MTPEEKLKNLPVRPGVYYFKDAAGKVIYVGKAVSLRNRVRSYYQNGSRQVPKIRSLMDRAVDFEYIVTDNEVEALILEANLIKEHRPRYNVFLKDDKSYPYLKITLAEEFPRVSVTRRLVQDGSRYYGPYTEVGAVQETLNLLRRLFPFRTCKKKIEISFEEKKSGNPARNRPCLNYHIRRCLAPCCGYVSRDNYRALIEEVCLFLEGRQEDLFRQLTARMRQAAAELQFEKAAELRDQIAALKKVIERQKIISLGRGDQDVIAAVLENDLACAVVFYIRGGKLIGREKFFLPNAGGMTEEEVVTAFLKQYYHQAEFIPNEVLVSGVLAGEKKVLADWLAQKKGGQVKLQVPARGEKKKMVAMALENARLSLEEGRLEQGRLADGEKVQEKLAETLGLRDVPGRLECFDVSNIQGAAAVASLTVWEKGRLRPGEYRRFRIRTVGGPDDYASLREAVRRRFARGKEEERLLSQGLLAPEKARFVNFPGLVVVDGGKGQLSAVRAAMDELGFGRIPVCALAKKEECIFLEGREEPLRLPGNSPVLHLLQQLRDEAHRFAVAYHRKVRTRSSLGSLLDEIEGIGPARRRALMRAFPSLEAIQRAGIEELANIKGMNRSVAEAVYRYFRKEREQRI
ncbi:MAG: excinuclease ABC subunit UvrC [Desulfotomaculales bacterium]